MKKYFPELDDCSSVWKEPNHGWLCERGTEDVRIEELGPDYQEYNYIKFDNKKKMWYGGRGC